MVQNVTIYLDDNELEFADHSFRCGHIVALDENGEEFILHDLIDNTGFSSIAHLANEVAGIFKISRECIDVAA